MKVTSIFIFLSLMQIAFTAKKSLHQLELQKHLSSVLLNKIYLDPLDLHTFMEKKLYSDNHIKLLFQKVLESGTSFNILRFLHK